MPITDIGTVGTANDYNDTNLLSVTVASDIPVGRILVVWYATDSLNPPSPYSGGDWMNCVDSKGNIYCTVATETSQQAFYFTGAMGQIFVARVKFALESGDTITTWGLQPDQPAGPNANQKTAKVMSVREFDFAGKHWAISSVSATNQHSASPAAIPSTGNSPGGTREWLFLHHLGVCGPFTDSYTWDADYTQIDADGTTGLGASIDITLRGGFVIDTVSSAPTCAVTNTTSNRAYVQMLKAITPVSPKSFGKAALVDDFNRADEYPLDNGGIWNQTNNTLGGGYANLISNQISATGGSRLEDTFDGDCIEVFATLPTAGTYPSRQNLYYAINNGSASGNNLNGHGISWELPGGPSERPITIGTQGNSGLISPRMWCWIDPNDGDRLGVKRRPVELGDGMFIDDINIDRGYGWESPASIVWYSALGVVSTGWAGLGTTGGGTLDDFHAGDVPCVERTQIYRVLHSTR